MYNSFVSLVFGAPHGPEPIISKPQFEENCGTVLNDMQKSIDQYAKDGQPVETMYRILPNINGWNEHGRKIHRCLDYEDFVSDNLKTIDKIVLNVKYQDFHYTRFYRYKIDKKTLEISFDD